MIEQLSEQEQLRRRSLAALRELGIDPYPAQKFDVTATATDIAGHFDAEPERYADVAIAGRITIVSAPSAVRMPLTDHT